MTTGVAYCGILGNRFRSAYTIMGDVVNRAAKLASSGDDPVIIRDPQTEIAARQRPGQSSLSSVELLAASDAMVPGPSAGRGVSLGRRFLVGREKELGWLLDRVSALLDGNHKSTINVVGDAGIGKSSLVYALRDLVVGRALIWHSTTDPLLGATIPYGAWRPIFTALFGREDAQTDQMLIRNVCQSLERQGRDPALSALASAVLPVVSSPGGIVGDLSPEDAARLTRSTLIWLLRDQQQGQPCIIVLEDTHWMDASSWALALLVTKEL